MTLVDLQLTAADPALIGTPIVVEAKPLPSRRGSRFVVLIGRPHRLTAEGDHCVFSALLPSGETTTEIIALSGPAAKAVLDLGEHGDPLSLFTTARQRVWGSFTDSAYRGAWIRLWRQSAAKKWAAVPWPASPISRTDCAVAYRMSLPELPHMVQTGGYGMTPQLTVLPSSPQVRVTVLPAAGRAPWLATFVTTDDLPGESLRGYLSCGAVEAARMVADATAGRKEESLAGRLARGYLSLRARSTRELPTSDTEPALTSDEAVIRGWRMLNGDRDPDPDDVRAAFLRAAELGTPLFPEGVRLLVDGLRRHPGRQSAAALQNLAPLLEAADLAGPTTAFAGTEPDRPAAKASNAVSESLPHAQALAAAHSPDATVPIPGRVSDRVLPGGLVIKHTGEAWLRRDLHTAQDAVDVLSDVSLWRLTSDRWQRLSRALENVLSAIQSADINAFQSSIVAVELLGPTRAHTPNKTAVDPPADVDTLVGALIEVISVAANEQGADRTDGRD